MPAGVCNKSVYFRYNSSNEDNFGQATLYWNSLTPDLQNNVVLNIVQVLKLAAHFLQVRQAT
jgi:catalase